MKSSKKCPKKTKCKPISNVISSDKTTFVCICFHGKKKHDIFRHCFKSANTESCYDYDEYDMKSVISVLAEGLLYNELIH